MNQSLMDFYENFNSSAQSRPHFEGHDIFVKYVSYDGCGSIQDLPHLERCAFVRRVFDCSKRVRLFNYMEFMYCTIQRTESEMMEIIYIGVLVFMIFYVLQIMKELVAKFLITALKYFSKALGMSQNVAGATIVSMANSAGTLFARFADLKGGTTRLYTGATGSAIFQLTIVAGSVMVIKPFHVYGPLFVRDSLFLLAMLVLIQYMMVDGTVNVYESSSLLVLYVVYLVAVAIDALYIRQLSKEVRRKIQLLEAGVADEALQRELEVLKEEGVTEILVNDSAIEIEANRNAKFEATGPNTFLFRQFIEAINPIDKNEWQRNNSILKCLQAIRSPFTALWIILCPRVDYARPIHGWSKLLNMLHLFTAPLFLVSMHSTKYWTLLGVTIYVYIFLVATGLAVAVFFTSRTDRPPIYHLAYSIYALAVTVLLVRELALETTSLTYTILMVTQMSPSFFSVTINAWESGVGALIANTALAYRGYSRMAHTACYGATLFGIPISFGVRFLYKAIHSKEGVGRVNQGPLGSTVYTIMFSIILTTLFGVSIVSYQGRKSLGYFRMLIYPVFLLFAVLAEFEIIHGHSTDHTDQRVKMQ